MKGEFSSGLQKNASVKSLCLAFPGALGLDSVKLNGLGFGNALTSVDQSKEAFGLPSVEVLEKA